MLKLFTVIIIILSLVSTSLITMTTIYTKHLSNIQTQQDLDALHDVKYSILNKIIHDGNNKLIPYGENGDNYHQIPNWITFKNTNKYGNPYIYCPYSKNNILTSNNNVLNSDSSSYLVETVNNLTTFNKDYVLRSEQSPINGLLAIIISPKSNLNIHKCSDIYKENGKFFISDGFVETIFEDEVLLSDINKIESYSLNVLKDTITSVEDKLNNWNAIQPSKITLNLLEGNYFKLHDGNLFKNESIDNKSIYLIGSSSLNYSYINGYNKGGTVTFDGVELKLKNIISNDIKFIFKNSNVILENSSLSNITLNNSKIKFDNSGINNSDDNNFNYSIESIGSKIDIINNYNMNNVNTSSNIYLFNSELNFYNSTSNINVTNSTEIFQLVGSKANIYNSNININTSNNSKPYTMYTIDSSSVLNVNSSSLNMPFSTAFLSTYGKSTFYNTSVSLGSGSDFGFVVSDGGFLSLNNVNLMNNVDAINNKVITGISDQGASQIIGDNNNIYAVTCTSGDIFNEDFNLDFVDNSYNGTEATTENKTLTFNIRKYFNKININCI